MSASDFDPSAFWLYPDWDGPPEEAFWMRPPKEPEPPVVLMNMLMENFGEDGFYIRDCEANVFDNCQWVSNGLHSRPAEPA